MFPVAESLGQSRKVMNLPKYDNAPYHFGFTIGLNQMLFTIKPAADINTRMYFEIKNELGELLADSAMMMSVSSRPTFGFDIGIVGDKRLGRYFNLRFVPALSFGERNINYTVKGWDNGEIKLVDVEKNIGSVFIDFPFMNVLSLFLKYAIKYTQRDGHFLVHRYRRINQAPGNLA